MQCIGSSATYRTKNSMQTLVWDDLVGRPRGFRSGAERAHRRTFYLSDGAKRANRRLNRAGRTAAPYEREGPATGANPMVAYSFSFKRKKKKKKKKASQQILPLVNISVDICTKAAKNACEGILNGPAS
jgi:hypothetical protein